MNLKEIRSERIEIEIADIERQKIDLKFTILPHFLNSGKKLRCAHILNKGVANRLGDFCAKVTIAD